MNTCGGAGRTPQEEANEPMELGPFSLWTEVAHARRTAHRRCAFYFYIRQEDTAERRCCVQRRRRGDASFQLLGRPPPVVLWCLRFFFFGYPSANPTAREVAVTYQPSMSCQRDSPALGKAQPGMACQRVGGQTGLTRSAHELQASPVATFSFLPLTFLFLKEKQNWIPVSPFAAGLWPLSQR